MAMLRCVAASNETLVIETPLQKILTNGHCWVFATLENAPPLRQSTATIDWTMEVVARTNVTLTAVHRLGLDRYESKVSGTCKIEDGSIHLFLEHGIPATQRYRTLDALLKDWPGARTDAASRLRGTEAAVMDGLRALKAAQNQDGSWGAEQHRYLATALVLNALLNHGEAETSQEFGRAVAKAHTWLMAHTPSTNAERIATAVALSAYDILHFGTATRDHAQREIAKVRDALATASLAAADPWTDYLTLHLIAPEVERPPAARLTQKYSRQWKDRDIDLEPASVAGYVALCAASLGKFNGGGQTWDTFNKAFAPKTVQRQMKDGFWPCADPEERFACTALAIESMGTWYAWRPPWPAEKTPEKPGEDIKVDLK